MNERIRELAVEATKYSNTLMIDYLDLSDEDYKEKYNQVYNKKFAELIVKECLDQCYNRGMNDAFYAGQLQAAAYIEQHFGVEE